MKTEETDCAKLRNQLTPFYNLSDIIVKSESNPNLLPLAIQEAMQVSINKKEVDRLLLSIENASQPNQLKQVEEWDKVRDEFIKEQGFVNTAQLELIKWLKQHYSAPKDSGKELSEINKLLELLALHGGKIVSTASLDVISINNAKETGRMYVDENSLGFVWEPNFYGGGKLFMIPETEEEVAWFDKWFPVCPPLPEKLKFENMFPSCGGAKCTIKNCNICKNKMY